MAYVVKTTLRAERDLASIFTEKDAANSQAALKWYFGLTDALFSLEEYPERCPETLESRKFRQLLYGNKPHIYRIIYRILEKQKVVEILHIRHGARKNFKPSELT